MTAVTSRLSSPHGKRFGIRCGTLPFSFPFLFGPFPSVQSLCLVTQQTYRTKSTAVMLKLMLKLFPTKLTTPRFTSQIGTVSLLLLVVSSLFRHHDGTKECFC